MQNVFAVLIYRYRKKIEQFARISVEILNKTLAKSYVYVVYAEVCFQMRCINEIKYWKPYLPTFMKMHCRQNTSWNK